MDLSPLSIDDLQIDILSYFVLSHEQIVTRSIEK